MLLWGLRLYLHEMIGLARMPEAAAAHHDHEECLLLLLLLLLLLELQLFGQRAAQVGVVIDDQEGLTLHHRGTMHRFAA